MPRPKKLSATEHATMARYLNERMRALLAGGLRPPPRSGWVRALRQVLGMTTTQLGARLGVSQASLVQLEKREALGAVTLATLERTAAALGCRLVYGFVPVEGEDADDLLTRQAGLVADRILGATNQSMALEAQGLETREIDDRRRALSDEMLDPPSPALWEDR